jgi:hypothetical protein
MTATLAQNPIFHHEEDGKPLSGGRVYTFASGTHDDLTTYQDEAQTIENTNPVILDSNGDAVIRLIEDQAYRIVIKDSMDSVISTTDDVRAAVTSSTASGYLKKSGAGQSVSSVVTFTVSPKVPTPTADDDVANKAFVLGSTAQGVQGASRKLVIETTGTSAPITITADAVTVKNAADTYRTLRNVALSVSLATSGANGLDTGSVAASTWYFVHVIWNETTVVGLASLSATAPTLPTGYTYSARIGAVYTDGTANKYPLAIKQMDKTAWYKVVSGSNSTSNPTMHSGATGDVYAPTWTTKSVTPYVPGTAVVIKLVTRIASGQIMIIAPQNTYGGFSTTPNFPPVTNANSTTTVSNIIDIPLITTDIYVAANSGTLNCAGWIDS